MQIRIPKKGYLGPFPVRNIPVFIHWTFPVGGLFIAVFLGDLTLETIIPLALAYTTLVLIHEFGHALAAKMSGNRVQAVVITGAGGWCFADQPDSLTWRFLFYAGGIIAQLVVLIFTAAYLFIFQSTGVKFLDLFAFVFTFINTVFIFVNIFPSEHTDGRLLWDLFRDSER
jgi:Zn-dependent protease